MSALGFATVSLLPASPTFPKTLVISSNQKPSFLSRLSLKISSLTRASLKPNLVANTSTWRHTPWLVISHVGRKLFHHRPQIHLCFCFLLWLTCTKLRQWHPAIQSHPVGLRHSRNIWPIHRLCAAILVFCPSTTNKMLKSLLFVYWGDQD